jgi:WD40 repeat protein/transcriptional regulator with XRE-family HTH domain
VRRYKDIDYSLGQRLLSFREKAGLTQLEIAELLGVNDKAFRNWELGNSFPTGANLKKLIELFFARKSFTPGQEYRQAKELWELAAQNSSRHLSNFDEEWFRPLFETSSASDSQKSEQSSPIQLADERPGLQPLVETNSSLDLKNEAPPPVVSSGRMDWGEAPDISAFYGRESEITTLKQWVLDNSCRVVSVVGMGGMGKTTLVTRFAHKVAARFDFVFWRSLRNAPPLPELLGECIQLISRNQPAPDLSQNNEQLINTIIELLRERRCLLVLDNLETVLEEGKLEGNFRPGFEAYNLFLKRVAQSIHQSSLLLTCRETLSELEPLEGSSSPVRTLKLGGIEAAASQELLKDKALSGDTETWAELNRTYASNPLVLKIVGEAIRELFNGDIASFLQEGQFTFKGVRSLLKEQFERLSLLEQTLLFYLAIEREPVSFEELGSTFALTASVSRAELLESLSSLRQRCLVERSEQAALFTLQPVVLEYVTYRLVKQLTEEITQSKLDLLLKFALVKAQAKDYLRGSQERLILQPLLRNLLDYYPDSASLEQQLIQLVEKLKTRPLSAQGYAGGNLVNLLVALKGQLRGADFSKLAVRQAYLAEVEIQEASFAHADLSGSVFMDTFDGVSSLALSQDGNYLAVGSLNGKLRIWQINKGQVQLAYTGYTRTAWALAFSPDSIILASGSIDANIRLWQRNENGNWQRIKTLRGHTKWVKTVVFNCDGDLLASGSEDGTARVWNIPQGECLQVLKADSGMVWSLAFNADGILASGGDEDKVKLWKARSGECLKALPTGSSGISSLAFSSDGKILVTGGKDGNLKLWETGSGQNFKVLPGHPGLVWSLAYSPDKSILASGGYDGIVKVWDSRTGQLLRTLQGHTDRVWTAFSLGGMLASGSIEGKIKLWDVNSGQCLRTLTGYARIINSLAFSPDTALLASGSDNGLIRLWEIKSGECIKTLQGHISRVWTLAFSPNGNLLASGGNEGNIKLWDIRSGQCFQTLQGHRGNIWALAFSPDGSRLVSGSLDRTVKLWKIKRSSAKYRNYEEEDEDSNCLITLEGHGGWVFSVAFSPDGKLLASGCAGGEVKLWEASTGEPLETFKLGNSHIYLLKFSPDGKALLGCSEDELVRIWEVKTAQTLLSLNSEGQVNYVQAIDFNWANQTLVIGQDDQTIKVWKLNESGLTSEQIAVRDKAGTDTTLQILNPEQGQLFSLVLSADGNLLASGSDDGTINLWGMQTGQLLRTLQRDLPYEQMNIKGVTGLTEAQKISLLELGATEK